MIPIHFAVFSDLDQKTEQLFRDFTPEKELEGISFSVTHGGDLSRPEGRMPVLITGDPRRLKRASEMKFRTVYCADSDQLTGCSFDVLWPAEETEEERREHFKELLHLLLMEHVAWEYQMLLNVAINTVPDLMWFKRLDGSHMLVNQSFAKTVQKDISDIIGKDHYYIWDAPRPIGNAGKNDCSGSEELTIRSGKTCSFEEEVESGEGLKQLTTYKTPLYDPFGKVFGTVGVGHDVTNIKNLGIELSILVENIPVPMFAASTDWSVVRMNSAFMELSDTDHSVIEEFDYMKWKKENLLSMTEPVVDRERHMVKQEFSWKKNGEEKIFMILEQEVRDHFDHISGYFCLMEDITLRRRHSREMDEMAVTDALTGLYNRRYFYQYLQERAEKLWVLLYMDLDGFKAVNDTFGHRRGDRVLHGLADLLREIFPNGRSVRLGGDEFAVLLETSMQEGVLQGRIRRLEERTAQLIPENKDMLSISVGVVVRRGEIEDVDAFIHEGDSRMYEIKRRHHAERDEKKGSAPGDDDTMVELRYMEGFRKTFIEMEGSPWSEENRRTDVEFRNLCYMLRIGSIEVLDYATPELEHAGKGEAKELFRDGTPDKKRFVDRRYVTPGYNIIFFRAYQKEGDRDWNQHEEEGVDLVLRIIFVMDGRSRLMHLAERLSFHDQAMEIRNHKYYMQSLTRLCQEGRIGNYTAIFLNLKRFSVINQQLGRERGSLVMRRYVKTLESRLSGDELICRVGGDNYVLLVEKDHEEDILEMAKEMLVVYNDETGDRVRITATMGIYVVPETGGVTPSQIMDRISSAGQQARFSIDETIIYYDSVMMQNRSKELDMETGFRDALIREEFEVYYQPKVDMETYTMTGAEALCRWNLNDRVVPPEEFIPILEQSMEICALDMYMLDHVCKDIRRWLDQGRRVPRISVNLSRRNLADVDLLSHILNTIDRNNVPHDYLEIEITETTTDVQFMDLKRLVTGLQKEGIKTAVDDFGVGYSSLTLIRDIPWNVLKIDKGFLPVQGDEVEMQKTLMFRYVVAMAQSLGLKCIVEGIETPEQLRLIQQNGCDEAQGFFFDRPLKRDIFEQRMEHCDYAKLAGSAGVW